MNEKEFATLTGLSVDDFNAITPGLPAHADDFAFSLYILKHVPSWDMAAIVYANVFRRDPLDERTLRRRVRATLLAVISTLPFHTESRFHCTCLHFPQITTMVDCTPVRIRGDATTYNGKYGTKVRKYQVYTDLRGIPIDVQAVPSRQHDAPAARENPPGFDEDYWELTLADKGYVGVNRMLVPFKTNQIRDETRHLQENCNVFHSLVRAKIEHLFARMRKFEIFAHSRYTAETTDIFVLAAYRIQSALMLMHEAAQAVPLPRFVEYRDDGPDPMLQDAREARESAMRSVWDHGHRRLRGKTPAKRARGAPAFTGRR
jgi:hypothetical protein